MIAVKQGDFVTLSRELEPASVDAIITDPPYPKKYLPLWAQLGQVANRVLKPGGYLVSYSGSMFLPEVMGALDHHLEWFWQFHLIHQGRQWSKVNHDRCLLQEAKPVLVFSKGHRRPLSWPSNVVRSGGKDKRYHHWGQSLDGVQALVDIFTKPGDLVLDPFVGGGTTAEACLASGRDFIGYDINGDAVRITKKRIGKKMVILTRGQIGKAEGLDITVKSGEGIGRKFAPTWEMVMGVKNGSMTEAEYTQRYHTILDNLDVEAFRDLFRHAKDGKLRLLCYCRNDQFCHTFLLAQYLVNHPIYSKGFVLSPWMAERIAND